MKAQCANCEWTGDAGDCDAINDIWERVEPGEIMPAGECPECGALAHLERPLDPLPAAAPELLAALKAVLEHNIAHHNHMTHAAARAAIAKAEGRS